MTQFPFNAFPLEIPKECGSNGSFRCSLGFNWHNIPCLNFYKSTQPLSVPSFGSKEGVGELSTQ